MPYRHASEKLGELLARQNKAEAAAQAARDRGRADLVAHWEAELTSLQALIAEETGAAGVPEAAE